MKKIMHIIATPRKEESRTLRVSEAFLDALKKKHPDWVIDELRLFREELPELTVKTVGGKYVLLAGEELTGDFKDAWRQVIAHIQRFLSADVYLISVPMWNFGIPYALKHYIDIIIQPKYLFRYTQDGVEGLAKNKKMVVVSSRGGDYSRESAAQKYDLQEPYLRAIFGFVGISEITFVNAQPMDALGEEVREEKIKQAVEAAKRLAGEF